MDDAPRTRLGLIFAVVVVGTIAAMWLYLFLVADPNVPDQLDDEVFPAEAQAICAAAAEQIDELPDAREAETPEDRAPVVAEANEILLAMVADLRAIAPSEGTDERVTRLWLEDWDTYISDREEYADALADGEEAELLVTARTTGGQITETIDHFAEINNMEDCAVPLDVG